MMKKLGVENLVRLSLKESWSCCREQYFIVIYLLCTRYLPGTCTVQAAGHAVQSSTPQISTSCVQDSSPVRLPFRQLIMLQRVVLYSDLPVVYKIPPRYMYPSGSWSYYMKSSTPQRSTPPRYVYTVMLSLHCSSNVQFSCYGLLGRVLELRIWSLVCEIWPGFQLFCPDFLIMFLRKLEQQGWHWGWHGIGLSLQTGRGKCLQSAA